MIKNGVSNYNIMSPILLLKIVHLFQKVALNCFKCPLMRSRPHRRKNIIFIQRLKFNSIPNI